MSSTTVLEQIGVIHAYATSANTEASTAMNDLKNMDFPYVTAGPVPYEPPAFIDPVVPSQPSEVSIGTAPDINAITVPDSPDKPTIREFADPSLLTPVIPDEPVLENAVWDPVELGTLFEAEMPTIPTLDYDTLAIDKTVPLLSINSPKNWEFSVDSVLISDDPVISAAITRLKNNIVYGGTGLSASVEADIWNRDLERNEQQLSDTTDKILSGWAKRGFSLPDGLLAHSLSEVQKEYMNKMLDRSREIAVKQAELEQSNLFKSLELTVNLAFKLVDARTRYAEYVFKGQEATAKFANEYIDLQIKTYNSMLDELKARVQVYEGLIRSDQLRVSIYKAQIDSELARISPNDQTVKIYAERNQVSIAKYRGVLDGNQTEAAIYNTEMQGVAIQESVNETRVKRYAEMIRAEMSKVERYKAEIDAMTAQLGVEKAKIESNRLQLEAWAQAANVKLEQFKGMVNVFTATSQTNVAVADLQAKQTEAAVRSSLSATELNVKLIEINNRSLQASAALRLEAAKTIASTAASRAAGAMAAAHASSTDAYSESKTITA
ncbi:MAG: hypothetical protein WC294_00015 [Methanoregula sp.]|jgi:hypothetical protein